LKKSSNAAPATFESQPAPNLPVFKTILQIQKLFALKG
jgi:hypothetical protein